MNRGLVWLGVVVNGALALACGSAPPPPTAAGLATASTLALPDAALTRLLAPRDPAAPGAMPARLMFAPPASAHLASEVGRGGWEHLRLRLRLEGVEPVARQEHQGRSLYEAVAPGADLITAADGERAELCFLLHHAGAPTRWSWAVELGAGLARVRALAHGGLAVEDGRGQVVLGIAPPFALDARGVRRAAELSWVPGPAPGEGRLAVSLDPAGLAYPILLDPAFESGVWEPWTLGPRSRHAVAFDRARGRAVTFGGIGASSAGMDEVWEWTRTSQHRPPVGAVRPVTRQFHALAFDTQRARTVLFGGADVTTSYDDTWEWDGTVWTERTPVTRPPARDSHAMAYDTARGRLVMHGGQGAGVGADETWEWDGTDWARRTSVTHPGGRTHHALAYDEGRGVTVLFSGTDTWEWDGTDWTARVPAVFPPNRWRHAMAYDTARAVTVLFGGEGSGGQPLADTWAWDGTTWSEYLPATRPPARKEPGLAWDSVGARVILYGGTDAGGTRLDDRWEWDGTDWSLRPGNPPARGNAAAAPGAGGTTLLFGGYYLGYRGDTWQWDGTSWSALSPATSPPVRSAASMVRDTTAGVTLLFGGAGAGDLNDLWAWDGTDWRERLPAVVPPARFSAGMVHDPARRRTVLFGGYRFDGATFSELGDTWEYDGSTWVEVSPATSPPPRQSGAFAHDARRGVSLLFGGLQGSAALGDTWTWDGTAWSQRVVLSGPSPRFSPSLTCDDARGRCTLFGGFAGTSALGDTWEWDGSAWSQLTSGVAPSPRSSQAQVYDPVRRQTLLAGGYGTVFLDDVWLYHAYGGACGSVADCDTDHCVDGVCCEEAACPGTCVGCNGVTPGRCSAVVDAPDPDTCAGTSSCGPTGLCGPANGQPCTSGAGCASGRCVDGVCCAQAACGGSCQACNTPTAAGTCAPVRGAVDPDTCAGGWTCDVGGACKLDLGEPCALDADCASAACVDGVCCDRACAGACEGCNGATLAWSGAVDGVCSPAPARAAGAPSCGATLCDGAAGSCPTSCTADASFCAPGFYCGADATCQVRKAAGVGCNDAAGLDCLVSGCRVCAGGAGTCSDGVCCDSPCAGPCDVCASALGASANGVCTLSPARSPGSPTCAPHLCDGASAACAVGCASDGDCSPGAHCDLALGACRGDLGPGLACGSPAMCASGYCVDGVCCNAPCDAVCQACSAAAKESGVDSGTCGPAAAGADPHGSCPDDGVASCQRDGTCDGSGQCRLYALGAACRAADCSGATASQYGCDGFGACLETASVPCGLYRCQGGACAPACTDASQCDPTAWCDSGVCVPKATRGQACTADVECDTALCVDGVCCSAPCRGQCEACSLAGAEGTCVAVNGAPVGGRAPCAPAPVDQPCAQTVCDGTARSSCAGFVGTDVGCRAASCADGNEVLSARCDGRGECPVAETRRCAPYACGADRCLRECSVDADCSAGSVCADAFCVTGATCHDAFTVAAIDGALESCRPYRCTAGACAASCVTTPDCESGYVCDRSLGPGVCAAVGGAPAPADEGGCGCRTPPQGRRAPLGAGLLTLALLAAWRARPARGRRPRPRPAQAAPGHRG